MIEFITAYMPQIATVGAVLTPMIPLMVSRSVNDKKLLTKVEDVKGVAEKLSVKELSITKDLAEINKSTSSMKADIEKMQEGVKCQMEDVKTQLLGFQQDDVYQKMLVGLGQLDTMNEIIKNQETLIQSQAQTIKDIKKKIG